jgi:hypothetical protein
MEGVASSVWIACQPYPCGGCQSTEWPQNTSRTWESVLMVALPSQGIEDARHGRSRPGPRLQCNGHAIAVGDDVVEKFLAEI